MSFVLHICLAVDSTPPGRHHIEEWFGAPDEALLHGIEVSSISSQRVGTHLDAKRAPPYRWSSWPLVELALAYVGSGIASWTSISQPAFHSRCGWPASSACAASMFSASRIEYPVTSLSLGALPDWVNFCPPPKSDATASRRRRCPLDSSRDSLNKSLNASALTPSFLRRQEPKTLWTEVPAFAGTTGRDNHPGHGLIQRFPGSPQHFRRTLLLFSP